MTIQLRLDWWPVGQGLFSSGCLFYDSKQCVWVYDCGTSSSDRHLEEALLNFAREQSRVGASVIDFAVLSHFDRDHVSGFERLVARHPIRMVLLPYIPLWQRLLIAEEEGVATDERLFRFFVDPAEYLLSLPGQDIGEIVFVPASEPDDGAPSGGAAPFDPVPGGSEGSDLKAEYAAPPTDQPVGSIERNRPDARVKYLAKGGKLHLPFWEFVPYNDAGLTRYVDTVFLAKARPLIERLIGGTERGRAGALKTLKALYDRTFGRSSLRRNQISLFLYSGPLRDTMCAGQYREWGGSCRSFEFRDRYAQISPGDGLLNTPQRLTAMIQFYGATSRIQKTGIFQVMHHGAAASWHPGIGQRLCPETSVFCSEPTDARYLHPHAEVLRDFWSYGPVQVDTKASLRITMDLEDI